MSVGFTFGGSINKLVGKALHLHAPGDLAGSYTTIGAGGALVGGAGVVRLQNKKGVVLELAGGKVGLEVSASVGSWLIAERYAEPEMRRTSGDEEFSTVRDLRDAASDCPRRRRTDYQL